MQMGLALALRLCRDIVAIMVESEDGRMLVS